MSRADTSSARRRVRRLALVVALAGLAVPLAPSPASAAVTCSFDAGTGVVRVEITGDGELGRLHRSEAGALLAGDIEDVTPCGGATVTNTERVSVTAAEGRQTFNLELEGGRLGPGRTAESDTDEIELTVNLGSGLLDEFIIEGTAEGEFITLGAGAPVTPRVSFTSDGDFDGQLFNVERVLASGAGGADTVSGRGGFGTGSPYALPLELGGGGEVDLVRGGLSTDVIGGGSGNDTLDGLEDDDTVIGNFGNDVVIGGAGRDELIGATPNPDLPPTTPSDELDRYVPGPDNDVVQGTPGATKDTVDFSPASGPVVVNLTDETATGEGTDTLISMDRVTGSAFDDTLIGTDGPNLIRGGAGGDLIQAQRDADTILPGPGSDDVRAGAGTDTLSYADSTVAVDVNLAEGRAIDTGTDTLAANIENVTGSGGPDDITGSTGPNVLFGFSGDDDIFGLEGDDRLEGAAGNDDLDGGANTDTCIQGTGTGTLTSCENVGTFELKPRRAEVSAGEPLDYLVTWTHPRRWRRLDTVELRVRDGGRVLAWVRWNQEGNTFQLFDPRADRFGPAGGGGSRGTLDSPFAVLHLRGSDGFAFDTRTIGVLMRLSFRPAAAGDHVVETTAEDDRNNRNAWEAAGTLNVLS